MPARSPLKCAADLRIVLLPLFAALLLAACGGSAPVAGDGPTPYRGREAEFDASRYRDAADSLRVASRQREGEVTSEAPGGSVRMERVMGFRVQIFSTTNLDEALARRDSLTRQLEADTVEVVFDAPYYKLRTGNFTERKEAEALRDSCIVKGVPDAWIVRDFVTMRRRELPFER